MEIATLADIIVAADDAVFALPEVSIGVGIDGGVDLRLAALMGPANANLMAFTGRRFDAAAALRADHSQTRCQHQVSSDILVS